MPAGLSDEHIGHDLRPARHAHQEFAGGTKGFDHLLDARIEEGDVGLVSVDPVEIQPHHERVVVGEASLQRLGQCGDLLA